MNNDKYRVYKILSFMWVLAFMVAYMLFPLYRQLIIIIFACLGVGLALQISFRKSLYTISYIAVMAILIYLWSLQSPSSLEHEILFYLLMSLTIIIAIISWIKRPKIST